MFTCKRRSCFTLIEQLIVIAIIGIMLDGVFRVYTTAQRVERSSVRQQEATRDLTILAQSWRRDVNRATQAIDAAGELNATSGTLILEFVDSATSATEQLAYVAQAKTGGLFTVERVKIAATGKPTSRQVVAEGLDNIMFGPVADLPMTSRTVVARRGFGALNTTQEFTAIAAFGGLR